LFSLFPEPLHAKNTAEEKAKEQMRIIFFITMGFYFTLQYYRNQDTIFYDINHREEKYLNDLHHISYQEYFFYLYSPIIILSSII
jgi:hypothetical protein